MVSPQNGIKVQRKLFYGIKFRGKSSKRLGVREHKTEHDSKLEKSKNRKRPGFYLKDYQDSCTGKVNHAVLKRSLPLQKIIRFNRKELDKL